MQALSIWVLCLQEVVFGHPELAALQVPLAVVEPDFAIPDRVIGRFHGGVEVLDRQPTPGVTLLRPQFLQRSVSLALHLFER